MLVNIVLLYLLASCISFSEMPPYIPCLVSMQLFIFVFLIYESFLCIKNLRPSLVKKERNFLNLEKGIYEKLKATIIENQMFPYKVIKMQVSLFSRLLLTIVLQILANVIKQDKEIKGTQIGKEDYMHNPKEPTKKTNVTIQCIQQSCRIQDQIAKKIIFLYTSNEQVENKLIKI